MEEAAEFSGLVAACVGKAPSAEPRVSNRIKSRRDSVESFMGEGGCQVSGVRFQAS